MTPGGLIREARARAGLSLRRLGVAAGGYSPQYMNDLEQDRRRLAPQRWHLLLRALPTLDKRVLAEAYLTSGPVELDAAVLTPVQRVTLLEALLAQAEPGQRKPPASRGAR
jgi:transcriptional regulator with XRE-family HTH domain